jgi:hypothetical protein
MREAWRAKLWVYDADREGWNRRHYRDTLVQHAETFGYDKAERFGRRLARSGLLQDSDVDAALQDLRDATRAGHERSAESQKALSAANPDAARQGWCRMKAVAKWVCPCGNQIRSSGSIPNPQEWHLLSDSSMSELFDDAPTVAAEDILHRTSYVYRCERCDRLHVFWDGIGEWPPTIYRPDSTDL